MPVCMLKTRSKVTKACVVKVHDFRPGPILNLALTPWKVMSVGRSFRKERVMMARAQHRNAMVMATRIQVMCRTVG